MIDSRLIKIIFTSILLYSSCAIKHAYGQTSSGFFPVNRFGISVQNVIGVDVGLISYNVLFGSGKNSFFDVSFGATSFFERPFVLAPKISTDLSTTFGQDLLTFGGGVDVATPTNFSSSTWMITPKIGITAGSLIRLYYGYHFWNNPSVFNSMRKHMISIELNVAAFHDLRIGL